MNLIIQLSRQFNRNIRQLPSVLSRNYSIDPQQRKDNIGNVALVTGASSGIGYAACEALLSEGFKNVIMSSIHEESGEKAMLKLRRKFPNACLCFCKCDVTKAREMENLFDQALSMHGNIDVLVNNAGILDEVSWEKMININVKGVVYGMQLAMSCMSKEKGGKGGSILNVSSIHGLQATSGAPAYTASKHFVIGLTRCFGMDYHVKKTGVRVMAMCPGITRTGLITKIEKTSNPLSQHLANEISKLPSQDPCFVGKGFITMLRHGGPGSVWVVEDEEIYEVSIPDRQSFRI